MKKKMVIFSSLLVVLTSFLINEPLVCLGAEPEPSLSNMDAETVVKVDRLASLPVGKAFVTFRESGLLFDQFSDEAMAEVFATRSQKVIALAINVLKEPKVFIVDEQLVGRNENFQTAKRICQTFSQECLPYLEDLYQSKNPVVKGNAVMVAGGMPDYDSIRDLLYTALNDNSEYEVRHIEMVGEPLRICDVAYNQIVLHDELRDFLRTIGNGHNLETRDYHIAKLKEQWH